MKKIIRSILLWFDNNYAASANDEHQIGWLRLVPFVACHLACLAVIWVGVSYWAVLICVISYVVRAFSLTGFYHRYFSHRTFKTSRWFQFIFAAIGATAVQRGALWWAAHHRNHHKYSDQFEDQHSPKHHGFLWSHFVWFTTNRNFQTQENYIKDWLKYSELVFLNRYDILMPILYAVGLYYLGVLLQHYGANTSGWQVLTWGFFISTVLLYHATFAVNSISHLVGKRRFETKDDSRNNWVIALLTLGEGWHNNHHYWPSSVRQGFKFWEIDITYYVLKIFAFLGLIWDLREPPEEVLNGKQPV